MNYWQDIGSALIGGSVSLGMLRLLLIRLLLWSLANPESLTAAERLLLIMLGASRPGTPVASIDQPPPKAA